MCTHWDTSHLAHACASPKFCRFNRALTGFSGKFIQDVCWQVIISKQMSLLQGQSPTIHKAPLDVASRTTFYFGACNGQVTITHTCWPKNTTSIRLLMPINLSFVSAFCINALSIWSCCGICGTLTKLPNAQFSINPTFNFWRKLNRRLHNPFRALDSIF